MSDLGTGAGEGAALATTALVGKSMRVGPSSPSEQSYAIHDSTGITVTTHIEELLTFVCMILPGGGSRLQTLGRLAA